MSRNPTGAVIEALWGAADATSRASFRASFAEDVSQFESALVTAYDDWLDFERVFAKDRDSATVVGALCSVVARLAISTNLLTLGHLTISGAAFRQAQEALASAFLLAQFDAPYRAQLWDRTFPVHKAVGMFRKQAKTDQSIDPEAVEMLFRSRSILSFLAFPP